MDLREAMRTRLALRRLRPDPVDDEVFLCVEMAVRAPTGGNRQGEEFIFVRSRNRPFARRERGR